MALSTLTDAQLRELQQQIPAELKRRESLEKVNVLKEVQAFAKERGYALEELIGKENKGKVKASGGKVKVKYRHPQNASLEWTGRGRKPKWVVEWLSKGKTIEALAV